VASHQVPPRQWARTSSDGTYRLELPPGLYDITFAAKGFAPEHEVSVRVAPKESTTVDASLKKGGVTLAGRVLDFAEGEVSGARVTAVQAVGAFSPPLVFESISDASGAFEMSLGAGIYSVSISMTGYAKDRRQLLLATNTEVEFQLLPASRLTGRVVDEHGNPVDRAEIAVVPDSVFTTYLPVRSDEDGAFQFEGLDTGHYRLWARYDAMVSNDYNVQVGATEATRDLEVVLSRGAALSGVVCDENGVGIAGATVRSRNGLDLRDRPVVATADGKGNYRLAGIQAGSAEVQVTAEGFVSIAESVELVGGDQNKDFRLSAGATLRGRVVANVADLRDITVTLVRTVDGVQGARLQQRIPDREGRFEFDGLTDGSVRLDATASGFGMTSESVDALRAGQVCEVELRIREGNGAWIAGTVHTAAGASAAQVGVVAFQGDEYGAHRQLSTATDAAGRFRLGPLVAGRASLHASVGASSGWANASPGGERDTAVVELREGATEDGVVLVIEPAEGVISGHVLDAAGRQVSDAVVHAMKEVHGPVSRRSASAVRVVSDRQGAFILSGLSWGKYTLSVTHPEFADTQVGSVSVDSADVQVRMQNSVTATGRVVRSDGTTVNDYTIQLFPAPPSEGAVETVMNDLPSRRVHTKDGSFSVPPLAPGDYQAMVSAPGGWRGYSLFHLPASDGRLPDIVVAARTN